MTVPSLCISRDSLEFSTVQCGQCQEETIQLYNQFQVPCKWFVTLKEPVKKVMFSGHGGMVDGWTRWLWRSFPNVVILWVSGHGGDGLMDCMILNDL